ncbi:hypothetical protein ACOI22_03345 [Glaciecola sp. 2405UD65-10]|uniref:hypothetical protein n=1 Tax=Glaciecola sp. 2405UD65-10 TaxID=3397244 RepID=UPI003B5CEB22
MDLVKRLLKHKEKTLSETVNTKTLGKVQLLPLYMSHRSEFHKKDLVEGERNFLLLMIALSAAEDGQRLVDSLSIDEVISMFDVLGQSKDGLEDLYTLYKAANNLSKVTVDDVEEAKKN